MAEVLLFHHAQGLTPGVAAFANELRRAGHIVHTPDLFDGRTFDSIEKGMSFVKELGFGEVMARGERAVDSTACGVGLCRILSRCGSSPKACPNPARRTRSAFLLFLYPGLGVWAELADGAAGSSTWHGCRSNFCW